MSLQIFRDAENIELTGPSTVKKGKRENEEGTKIPKPSKAKRVALSVISQDQTNTCRVQPPRAAKGKTKSNKDANTGFPIFEDELALYGKDSPMFMSPPVACVNITVEESQPDISTSQGGDLNPDPLLEIPDYASDVHSYLKEAERKNRPKPNYMSKQSDINSNMRAILIDWLVEVAQEYKLKEQTLCLTVNYIDRFLSFMSVQRSKLQLVGAACMFVAAKFEEIYPPEIKEFVYITDETYTSRQVLRMEQLILKTLSFNISVPTCHDFLPRYLAAADAPHESRLQYLSEYLCQLSLIDLDFSVKYYPSLIVASAVCIASMVLHLPVWSGKLEHYTEFKLADISKCARDLCAIFKSSFTHQQQAVQIKYKASKYGLANMVFPEDLHVLDQYDSN